MIHDPREYARQILLEQRDALHMSLDEGPQLGAGFHEAAVGARAELHRKRTEAMRHETERLNALPPSLDKLVGQAEAEDRRRLDGYREERRRREREAEQMFAMPVSYRFFVGLAWATAVTLMGVLAVMGIVFHAEIWAAMKGAL
jgi:hypothetical protein